MAHVFRAYQCVIKRALRLILALVILFLITSHIHKRKTTDWDKNGKGHNTLYSDVGLTNSQLAKNSSAKHKTNQRNKTGTSQHSRTDFDNIGPLKKITKNVIEIDTTKGHNRTNIKRKGNLNYKNAMMKLNKEKVAADDPRLIDIIRNYYILPPSTLDYNLTRPDVLDSSEGQAPFVDSRLKYKERGFFVECGALDGERASNTLLFERFRGWSGLLVEADPINFAKLMTKHRKAYAINACLNTEPFPATVTFKQAAHVGRIADGPTNQRTTEVQCFPLYSILLALNQLTVDFLSLDIEGDELKVLKTIPFRKVNITIMAVEYGHQRAGIKPLRRFVESRGFETLILMSKPNWWVNDLIFRKRGMTN